MILSASAMLLTVGYGDRQAFDWWQLDEAAALIVEACGDGPRDEPQGLECLAAMVAIWEVETASTFSHYPSARGTGCGPVQVIPGGFGNARLGFGGYTPPCVGLRVPAVGMFWGVLILRAKRAKSRTLRAAFWKYNGNPETQDRYAVRAWRNFLRAMGGR